MTTIKDLKNGAKLPPPIYISKPYIVTQPGRKMILAAGTADEIMNEIGVQSGYYDDCVISVRTHDLAMDDNSRIETVPPAYAELKEALAEIVSQIDQGGSGGKVFARDACIQRAREVLSRITK